MNLHHCLVFGKLSAIHISLKLFLAGLTEAIATQTALENLKPNIRSFVLSRSTFPGAGVHTAHWLGDNKATFDDLYMSIPGLLNFQLFGVTLVGADICGFGSKFFAWCMYGSQYY